MHNLTPITALGATIPHTDSVANVICTEVPGVALASVMARIGEEKKTATAIKKLTGKTAPKVGTFTQSTLSTIWIGPDQYLVECAFDTQEDLAADLKDSLKTLASVTEQTDAWVRFDITGDGVLDVLELCCILNTRQMHGGDAARSSIHHLGCLILCRGENSFSIYGPRSSAGSLHHALITAMTSAL